MFGIEKMMKAGGSCHSARRFAGGRARRIAARTATRRSLMAAALAFAVPFTAVSTWNVAFTADAAEATEVTSYTCENEGVTETGMTESPGNTCYFVDSAASDGGTGTQDKPFNSLDSINAITFGPGDKILIKSGSTFTGQLYPKGSGSEEAPIIIDMYSGDTKPYIDGNGRSSSASPGTTATTPFGQAAAAVYLLNSEYIEINNLEVSNWSGTTDWSATISGGADGAERSGIRVEATGGGTFNHIYIKNCYVHDVRGVNKQNYSWSVKPVSGGSTFFGGRVTHRTGGINFVSYTGRDTTSSEAGTNGNAGAITDDMPTIFNDILINGNTIERAQANGITTTNYRGELDDRTHRHTNVVITNNTISGVTRSGIITLYTSGVLVDGNDVSDFQQVTAADDYGYGCGIWADRANDLLYQNNHVYDGNTTADGEAFNFDDMTENGILQNNYSHNNTGGGILLHIRSGSYNRGHTIRYNLSVNDAFTFSGSNVDGSSAPDQWQAWLFLVGDSDGGAYLEDASVHNNTVVNTYATRIFTARETSATADIDFTNNVFYYPGQDMVYGANSSGGNGSGSYRALFTNGSKTTAQNNLFAVYSSSVAVPTNSASGFTNNIYSYGTDVNPLVGIFTGHESWEEARAKAKLITGSKAIGIGTTSVLSEVTEDAYGNIAVSADGTVNAGIYNGTAVSERIELGYDITNSCSLITRSTSNKDSFTRDSGACDSFKNSVSGKSYVDFEAEDYKNYSSSSVISDVSWFGPTTTSSNSNSHGSKHLYFTKKGSYIEVTFEGTGISVYTKGGTGARVVEIFLDGQWVAYDDQVYSADQFQVHAYGATFDKSGTHTIRLQTNSIRNNTGGNNMNIDFFRVYTN